MNAETRNLGQNFSQTELRPHWEVLDKNNPALLETVLNKAAANGVFSFLIEENLGGSGLGAADFCVFIEEISRACASAAAAFAAHVHAIAPLLLLSGTGSSNAFLSDIAKSDAGSKPLLFAPAVYEDSAHALFPETVNTFFYEHGGEIVVSGAKTNVQCASAASYFTLIARDSATNENAVLVIDSKTPGVEIKVQKERLGLRFCPSNDVLFNNAAVQPECVINKNAGKEFLEEWYEFTDPIFAAIAIGIASEARDAALKYSLGRYQGGKMICDHDVIRAMLSGMEIQLRASRAFAYGHEAGYLSSAFAAEAAENICLDAIQTLGGYGYIADYKIERMLRDAKTLKSSAMSRARGMEFIKSEIEKLK